MLGYSNSLGMQIGHYLIFPFQTIALLYASKKIYERLSQISIKENSAIWIGRLSYILQAVFLALLIYSSKHSDYGLFHWEYAGHFFPDHELFIDKSVGVIVACSLLANFAAMTIARRFDSMSTVYTILVLVFVLFFTLSIMREHPNYSYPNVGG